MDDQQKCLIDRTEQENPRSQEVTQDGVFANLCRSSKENSAKESLQYFFSGIEAELINWDILHVTSMLCN